MQGLSLIFIRITGGGGGGGSLCFYGVTDSSHIYVEQNNVLRVVTTKSLSDVATFNKAPSSLAAVTTRTLSRNLYRSKFWGRRCHRAV